MVKFPFTLIVSDCGHVCVIQFGFICAIRMFDRIYGWFIYIIVIHYYYVWIFGLQFFLLLDIEYSFILHYLWDIKFKSN